MSSAPTPQGPGSVSGAPHLPEGFTDTFTSRYVDNGELRLHAVTGGDGPVLLVGHSYGRAVITNAAATATGVVGLVFVAAFAPTKANAWERSRPTPRTASSTRPWSSASIRPVRTPRRR